MNFLKRTGSRIWPLWPFVRRVLSNSNHIRGCAAVLYLRMSTTSRCYEVCFSEAAAVTYKTDAGSKAKRLRRCGEVICRNWPTISNSQIVLRLLRNAFSDRHWNILLFAAKWGFKCAKGKFLDNDDVRTIWNELHFIASSSFSSLKISENPFLKIYCSISLLSMKNTKYERIDCTLLFLDRP